MHHWPLSTLILGTLGILALLAGCAALAGLLANRHPIFHDAMAGWGLIVTAIALLLSAGFPLVLRHLAEQEGA